MRKYRLVPYYRGGYNDPWWSLQIKRVNKNKLNYSVFDLSKDF